MEQAIQPRTEARGGFGTMGSLMLRTLRGQRHLFGRKLIEVVDAELFFERRDFVNVDVEAVASECLTFNGFKLLTHRVIFVRRDDLVQFRKEYRVLAGLVRRIHAVEEFEVGCESIAVLLRFQ